MPQDPSRITKAILKVLNQNPKLLKFKSNTSDKEAAKLKLLNLIQKQIIMLTKTNQITKESADNVLVAIKFYKEHATVPSYQGSPESLIKELTGIDFTKTVKVRKVKPDTLLTQMQQEWHSAKEGNFYTVGTLPESFHERASECGIGFEATCVTPHCRITHKEFEHHDYDGERHTKMIYISRTTKQTMFLESYAAPAVDEWSARDYEQIATGGGIQYRISDVEKHVERLTWGTLHCSQAPQITKPLSRGIGVCTTKFRRR